MPIRCVLFDHDDTLIPTLPLRARTWQRAVHDVLGVELDGLDHLRRQAGATIERTALSLTNGDEGRAVRLVEAYRTLYYSATETELACFPGVAQTLAGLRERGIRIAVVTSKIRAGAARELQHCGIDALVECLVGSDDVTHHKPHPEPLLAAARALGVAPAEALMVGDTAADLLAARAAGTLSAVALWGASDADSLLALAPTYALADVREVVAVVTHPPSPPARRPRPVARRWA